MADINVVPKRNTNMWLWIVLGLVVVALLIWAMNRNRGSAENSAPRTSLLGAPTTLAYPSGSWAA